ncbi:hypothetical protein [Bacteroides caecimuris]|uniref:hypothetical protein n=2 Tax=Bacteroidaceae TaxID=815 RepID=UPI001C3D5FCC|nr:hypothetical protein [Bacteroides caecimuris]
MVSIRGDIYPLRFMWVSLCHWCLIVSLVYCRAWSAILPASLLSAGINPSTGTARLSFVFHRGVRPRRSASSYIVEGRADVRIGIRDSVVHIDRTTARRATIVRIGTTEDSTEARNGS